MWAFFRANWRFTATIAIVLISAVGSTLIYSAYRQNQEIATQTQSQAFRNSVAVMRDLARLSEAALGFVDDETDLAERRASLETALDFLFVRTSQLKQSPRQNAEDVTRSLVNSIQAIVDYSDSALTQPNMDPEQFRNTVTGLINVASHRLLKFSDQQFQVTSAAIADQDALLETMTQSVIGLFLLFAIIAGSGIYLFERELRANKERRAAEKKADYLAFFDTLTGLPRRDRFRDEAVNIIARHERSMVMVLDIDDFKNVNDNHGHAAGDATLRHIAFSLREISESHRGIAARLGGDEFAAVIPGPLSSMRAAAICETLIAAANRSFDHDNIQISAKISIGVAFVEAEADGAVDHDLSSILKSADVALYRSKEEGKNTYSFFDSHLADIVARRRDLEMGITHALETDEFHLNFQPQVDLRSGALLGFEALARWTKDGERISPGEFIPVAEATGQVVDIDIFALRRATQQAVDWFHAGHVPIKISTNLSAMHFRNDDIVEKVQDALVDSGLPPYLLTLEITESAMIEDIGSVTRILEKLRALGVKTALDDFGTGYSSLAYLRMLDVDYIKIDQSFVRDLSESAETQLVVESLVSLAQGLQKRLVVEGIETDNQREIVQNLGCDVGQGYLFGRPLEEADARAMIPKSEDVLQAKA